MRSIITARETLNGPTPMDVSAIYKKKKGKEKGKGRGQEGKGKSTGKSDDKVNEKDPAANPDAEIFCYYCHWKGHRKRDCRAFENDSKKGVNAVDQAPGLTPGADAAPSGTPSRVSMIEFRRLDSRSQRGRKREDGGINRASEVGQWSCGFSLSARICA